MNSEARQNEIPAEGIAGFSRERIERVVETNLWNLWMNFGRGRGCDLVERDALIRFDTPLDVMPYNGVLCFAIEENTDVEIDAIFDHYKTRGVPFIWMVHPSAKPHDLKQRLLDRGMEEVDLIPGMAADIAVIPRPGDLPEGIEIREVRGERETDVFLNIVAWRWHVPEDEIKYLEWIVERFGVGKKDTPVRCWIAWRGDVPVGKALLNLADGAAGLYGVATKPEARGLGIGRAITLEIFEVARQKGYRLGVLHSSPMALSLYEKIGFRPVNTFHIMASSEFHV